MTWKKNDRSRSMASSEQHGGYDCEFVERPQELQADCPICMVVLREPFQVTCCGIDNALLSMVAVTATAERVSSSSRLTRRRVRLAMSQILVLS